MDKSIRSDVLNLPSGPTCLKFLPLQSNQRTHSRSNHGLALVVLAVASLALSSVHAQEAASADKLAVLSPATTRWQNSLDTFAKADQERQPASDGVLFVGSSTIRLWSNLSQDFRQLPVLINRGFGGSTMADCNALARELVIQYKPRQILVYAGDNDLAEGRLPADVLKSFTSFVQKVRAALPDSHIAYISVKPSPARLALLPRIRETNALISDYVQTLPNAGYIDTFSLMLDAQGAPRGELFKSDQLHLNEAGYQLWKSVIVSHLPSPPPQSVSTPEAGPATASR
jgi:lysophospholipase L1-like esterase